MLPVSSNMIPIMPEQIAIGEAKTPVPEFDENTALFCRCKEALYAIATHCPTPGKRAMLPAYTCETVIQPFRQAGWEFVFYPFDLNLRIKGDAFRKLLRQYRPNLVVAQILYGMDLNAEEQQLMREAHDAGCFVVEDLTQAMYSERRYDFVDAYVGSIRKWLPLPDGGFLRSEKLPRLDLGLEENPNFVSHMLCAQTVFRYYLQGEDNMLNKCYRALEHDAVDPVISLHRMSDFSKRIYATTNPEQENRQRMENCRYLWENLQDCKSCKPVYKSLDDMTTGPLWFPVYVRDKKEFLREVGRPYRFSAPGLWPVETKGVLIDDTIRFIYSHIVAITCSQNFGTEHMKRVVEGFRSWDATVEIPEL